MPRAFDRILIVMFENQYRNYVMQNAFMDKLARAGMNMTNFFGCFHPSQTNYLASIAGEVCAVTNDTPPVEPLMQRTLVDLMEEKGVSWKAYMEALPDEPWNPAWETPKYDKSQQPLPEYPVDGALAAYFRKHNAFASFHNVQRDKARWEKIVPDSQLWKDLAPGRDLPEYGWYTPDIWNDGHYLPNTHIDTNPRAQLVPQMATYLEHVFLGSIGAGEINGGKKAGVEQLGLGIDVDLLLTDPAKAWEQSRVPKGTLVVVTFDEADYDASEYDTLYDGPNQIYTVLLGDMIEPGSVCDAPLNHYSLLRTVERNFDLGDLGKNDASANWIRPLWGERFHWQATAPVEIDVPGHFETATLDQRPIMVFQDKTRDLGTALFDGGEWHKTGALPFGSGAKQFKVTGVGSGGLLVWQDGDRLSYATTNNGVEWAAQGQVPGARPEGEIALCGYTDTADGEDKAMLVWAGSNGFMFSSVYRDGIWQPEQDVDQLTDGPMTLAQYGPSLFLVYKERKSRKMRMISYNLAPFNAFTALDFQENAVPVNDTTLHNWAATDFPVGNFAKKLAALQNDYRAIGRMTMASIDGEMRLFHRGDYNDLPHAYEEVFALTGVFSSEDAMSNGYGGLDQAGWTREVEHPEVSLDPSAPLSLSATQDQFTMVWKDKDSGKVLYRQGGYSA